MRALLAAGLLVTLSFAGCVQSPASGADARGAMAPVGSLLAALQAAPRPALDGANVVAWLREFTAQHAPRITGTPGEKAAGDDLAAQLAALGYETEIRLYNAQGLPSADGPLRAIVATKTGAVEPERLIVLGGHYDTSFTLGNPDLPILPVGTGLTLEAAYDNGSGTAMVVELARLLAAVETNRTIVFALFNGEEEGLLASGAYADDLAAQGVEVTAYLGFDMVGINYPSAAGCLCIYAGKQSSADLNPLQETVAFDLLQLPRGNETVQVFDNHDTRNSDEASFASAGFPTMRWAGMAGAGDYWAYHKLNDTVETMVAQAGDEALLAQGVETAAATAYYAVLALDKAEATVPRD